MKRLLTLLLLILAVAVTAQNLSFRDSTLKVAFYPVGMYGSETGFGGGAVAYMLHRPQYLQPGMKPNSFNTMLLYTEKKQFSSLFQPEMTFPGDKWAIKADVRYSYWPDSFYGLGNATSLDDKEGFATESFKAKLAVARMLNSTLQLEALGYFRRWGLSEREADGMLLNTVVPGAESTVVGGLGLGLAFDDRDNKFSPYSGGIVEARCIAFDEAFGSDWTWTRFEFDATRFYRLWSDGVLGFQAIGIYNDGDVPFLEMARIGEELRGIKDMRFVDRHMAMTRAELRVYPFGGDLFSRVGFATFAETGDVAHELDDFALDSLKYTVGGGLRFLLLPDERLSIRIDIGFSEDDSDFAIAGTEKF